MAAKRKSQVYNGPGTRRPVKEGILLGFGNPLLDLVAEVPQAFFTKYDIKPANAILAEVKHRAMYEEMIKDYDVKYIAGGATQNSIRAAQWLLRSKKATTFVGAVGKDNFAKLLKEACAKDGLTPYYFETSAQPTGRCAVAILDNERSLVADLAAANCYDSKHIDSESIKKIINQAEIFYSAGFPLTVPESHKAIMKICKHADENNKTFCLNLAAPFIVEFFHDQLTEVLPYADFVFCNESEAAALIKKRDWKCNIEEAALKLSALPKSSGSLPRTVIFTQGKDATIVAKEGKVTLYPVPTIQKELLIDTNGAGDSFVGGFLAKLAQGFEVDECVRAGHYTARVIIQQSGVVFPSEPDI